MKTFKVLLMAGVYCAFLISVSCAQNKSGSVNLDLHIDKAKQFLDGLEKEKDFSGQAYISYKGKTLLNKGYGYADRENQISNNKNTAFDIGSLTKLYTKAAIIKLIEQGKLTLDESLDNIFKSVPTDKTKITVQQLLEMSSGLPEYVPGAHGDFDRISKENARTAILNHKLNFEPGTANEYSNSGYTVLAMIIEERSKLSYQDFIMKYIVPKDISIHGFYSDDHWEENKVAIGYDMLSHGKRNSPVYWPEPEWGIMGAGGLVTSAEGVSQWLEAIKGGKVLDKKHTALFDQLQLKNPTPRGTTALIRAGGSSYGFTSSIADYPIEQLAVVVSSNTGKFNVPEEVFRNLLSWLIRGEGLEQDNNSVRTQSQNSGGNASPKEAKLNEFLEVISEGNLTSYVKNNFSESFISDHGLEGHVEFLKTIREREGGFEVLETLENRMGFLKVLVGSKKTNENYALEIEFVTSPPFKIDGIGLSPFGGDVINKVVEGNSSEGFSPVENKLMEFLQALSGNESELKKYISDNFERGFLERHEGVDGHYNFLKNFSGGFNDDVELVDLDDNSITINSKLKKNNQVLKITLKISDVDNKITSLGISD
ncbi:class A beta-lactamase-related serine hydrolase [Flavobacteriaceae bacterium AU392]|nr:class A beta-lactamase-related serine hydrolase [Flavobacteriaceae bacterium]RKM86001.1 class A beta-lactamase-related serine hydrolase [Flavobacteriaceae bacterium AU392]